ncbi:MMPL family transporter [Kurthia sibirica]|uniref:SSD domain-containing protein n=1 Tax=Kurthia sibirica TaxID=202750 RepID=A0A2U3AKI5_9BACL|nr:MMPL family transporter [Kurthia sibirica]PWI25035.1 hypothetical protein DEX24_09825 [Kurthia sibirica]GEK34199.1 transporter [Kurthia sibirica]
MTRYAQFITKHAKIIIALWLIIIVIGSFFALKLPSQLQGDGFEVDGQHAAVMKEVNKNFDVPAHSILVVFENKSDDAIKKTLQSIKKNITEIDTIQSPIELPQQHSKKLSYAVLNFNDTDEDLNPIVDNLRALTKKDPSVSYTGQPVISKDMNVASQSDLVQAEMIGLPIAIIVLLLAFGTVVAAILPILIGVATIITTFFIMVLIGDYVSLSIYVLNIIPMLGLALSIDFSLLFINRYREERLTNSIENAIHIAIKTAGKSIIFSAVCVMIGLGAMSVIGVELFQNIALGGSIVVFIAVLTGLTLSPAVLMVLGDGLNKWTIIRVKPTATSRWHAFATAVMKRPVLIVITALIILGAMMIPIKDIKLTIPQIDALPKSFDARSAYEKLDQEFDLGKTSSVYALVERPDGWHSTAALKEISKLQKKLQDDSLVKDVATIFTASDIDSVADWQQAMTVPQLKPALTKTQDAFIKDEQLFIPITLNVEGDSSAAQQWARDWSSDDFQLAGAPKFNQEIFDEISDNIVLALTIIILSTFIILMIAFKSIVIPIKAILMNILGLSAAFGLLVYIFQYGHFGLEAGTIVLIIPVITFCLVFGLSMDYEVFLISRIQEEYLKEHNNTKATIDGLTQTSKIITSAALIMIVLTGSFAFTDVLPVKQIGVGIAIAIAIDATIIRLLLVPSLMKLFGDWNWWLPFSKKNK